MEQDWLYYRILVDSFEGTQAVLEHPALRAVIREARCLIPEGRYFFLRFADHRGLQIRLRIAGPLDALAELEPTADRMLRDIGREGLHQGVEKALYEPEFTKYGGPAGLAGAELLFQASSDTALGLFGATYWAGRFGYATLLTRLAVDLLPQAQHRSFLYNMRWYWTGQNGPHSALARQHAADSAARAEAPLRARTTAIRQGPHSPALLDYQRALRDRLAHPAARTPAHLLFHYVHLMNNRLGVKPIEEAVIADLLLHWQP
ncbi:thiopeptide-type bacteriocin biosynthesis protein [Kitasatospora sp. NPDC008050]|uniref:thiopeptide-type bacteriocin biosynthesis protein n=1 Tax=Kitasatospora sp. NPDC008050 TaxID=3364021 RepID=UPI0036E25957